MTQTVINSVLIAVLVSLPVVPAYADGKVDMSLHTVSNLHSFVKDGQIIGRGQISTQDEHIGYQVWLNAQKTGGAPNKYVITGEGNQRHKLYVMIGQDGWMPDIKSGKGVVKQDNKSYAVFSIVINGDQNIAADIYSIVAQGCYLEP